MNYLHRFATQAHDVGHAAGAAVLHDDPELGVLEVAAKVLHHMRPVALLHHANLLDNLLQVALHRHLESAAAAATAKKKKKKEERKEIESERPEQRTRERGVAETCLMATTLFEALCMAFTTQP